MKLDYLLLTENSFEGKRSYEQVHLLLYRHWYTLAEKLFAFILLALLPLILHAVVGTYLAAVGLTSLFTFFGWVYLLVWWFGLGYVITMYLLDTWVVTDHRIVDSEQHGFFQRSVAELTLAKIQDISVTVKGPIATFLDFGDVSIQTAGTKERFTFKQVPNPRGVKDQIMQAHVEYMKTHPDGREVHEEGL